MKRGRKPIANKLIVLQICLYQQQKDKLEELASLMRERGEVVTSSTLARLAIDLYLNTILN